MGTIELTAADLPKVDEFSGKLFAACLATMELANVELGVRLGLYGALATAGQMTAGDLAKAAGIVERYAQEWLEQQAVAGIVSVDDAAKPSAERRFMLPKAHAHVLTDDDSEACMKPCAAVVPWAGKALDIMTEEFRNGTGAAFGLFDLHDVQAAFTRPVFVNHLTQTWLPALPELQATVLVVDERTEDSFTAPANEMERLFYSFSTLHCLAVSRQGGGAGTGTVMRTDTLRAYANEAGFSKVDVLNVDHPQFRLYVLA